MFSVFYRNCIFNTPKSHFFQDNSIFLVIVAVLATFSLCTTVAICYLARQLDKAKSQIRDLLMDCSARYLFIILPAVYIVPKYAHKHGGKNSANIRSVEGTAEILRFPKWYNTLKSSKLYKIN